MALDNTTVANLMKESFNWQVYMALCITVAVVIALGNIMTILVIWKNSNLQTIPNKFIVNLAVADLLTAIQILPNAISRIPNPGLSSRFVCLSATVLVSMSFMMSLVTLVLIALDRYIYICQPLRYHLIISIRRANVIIISSWVCVTLFSCSQLYWNTWSHAESSCDYHHGIPLWFDVTNYILSVALSFVVLVLYGIILRVALEQRRKVSDVGTSTKRALSVSDFRFLKMIISVVVMLTLSWFPFNVVSLIDFIAKTGYRERAGVYIEYLFYSSSAANIFVYAFHNKDFMHAYKSLLSVKCSN